MRIAQVSPLVESVPPKFYGGTERIVAYLTDELVELGHDVTLYASGDSRTRARLQAGWPVSLRLGLGGGDHIPLHLVMLEKLARDARQFDVIHFHIDYVHAPLCRRLGLNAITTLHGRQDLPEAVPFYDEYRDLPLVSISDAQRLPLPNASWLATVHHGLPSGLFALRAERGGYLAFLGRVSPEKGLESAIAIAGRCGMELRIAAKVDRDDESYFRQSIAPLLEQPHVTFLGEVGEAEKGDFLGGAAALLFPIEWPEPFGLVMIEAMACGTPVVARRRGSVAEVVEQGLTGTIFDTDEAAVAAVHEALALDRRVVRRRFEARFLARRMAEDYLDIYSRLLAHRSAKAAS